MENDYTLITQIKIYNSDPISAINLNEEMLLFGTMLGYCGYYLIKEKNLKIISEIQDEHIIAIQFFKNKFIYGVGDQKIIILEKLKNDKDYTIKIIDNHSSDAEHYKKCEDTFCMLKDNLLFSIELHIPSEDEKSASLLVNHWQIKNILKNVSFRGDITISTFWVPFDFDGILLIYIDFLDGGKRNLIIYDCKAKKQKLCIKLWDMEKNETLGHISHIKKLKDDKIFLVHSYKSCQIRDLNFKLIKKFEHNGKEIIACDIYYNNKNELKIFLLDLNCSVWVYSYNYEYKDYLFNMHKLNSINQDIKDQKFFSLGYPYYIKVSEKYIAITTDQGCFLFKKT